MLFAYLDEIGQTGAFVSLDHNRYADSPAFGYGGFIIPEEQVRIFGSKIARFKEQFLKSEIPADTHHGRYEKKGSDLFYALAAEERPQNLKLLGTLLNELFKCGGHLFYYAEEKPIGTPKETNCGPQEYEERDIQALRESLNRLARHADANDSNLLIMMDQINEKSRKQRVPSMYAHILGRSSEHLEMLRILEPPMHIDSSLSTNIQFADWVCALIKRAIEYKLVANSRYKWVTESKHFQCSLGRFTYESKLHLHQRSVDDLHHSDILRTKRPVIDTVTLGQSNQDKLSRVLRASHLPHH